MKFKKFFEDTKDFFIDLLTFIEFSIVLGGTLILFVYINKYNLDQESFHGS